MNIDSLLGPAVVAAVVSGLISTVGTYINSRTTLKSTLDRMIFDREQITAKLEADLLTSSKKANLDQKFITWRRQVEFAEEILTDCYNVREVIMEARSPAGFKVDRNRRKRELGEDDDDAKVLDSYFQVIERLNKRSEAFHTLLSKRYRFSATFGEKAPKIFEELSEIRGEIILAAHMLLETYNQRAAPQLASEIIHWKNIIGRPGVAHEDYIGLRLANIIRALEELCNNVTANPPTA